MELRLFIKMIFLLILINEIKNECIFNKIESFSENECNGFSFIKMSNNDIFLISTTYVEDEQATEHFIYLYGLKSTNEKLYNDENGINYKKLNSIKLKSLNGINLKIEDKEYPFICSNIICELIDYEYNQTYNQIIIEFFKNITEDNAIFNLAPNYYPILNLNEDNKILFITFFIKRLLF